MMLTKLTVAGAAVALAGHGAAAGVTLVAAVAVGGGPNADLDSGGKIGVLMVSALTYGIAQLVLLGVCIATQRRLGPLSAQGLVAGWLLGFAASLLYMCGGHGA